MLPLFDSIPAMLEHPGAPTSLHHTPQVLQPDPAIPPRRASIPTDHASRVETSLLHEAPPHQDAALALIRRDPQDPRVVDLKRRHWVWRRLAGRLEQMQVRELHDQQGYGQQGVWAGGMGRGRAGEWAGIWARLGLGSKRLVLLPAAWGCDVITRELT